MNRIRTLVVDDEPLARDGLAMLLRDDPEIEIIGMCADGRSALAEIGTGRPDLVFLDVQMPECSGLEVYEALPADRRPAVVFVTAYDQHAVKAFELSAVDYVLKPFRDARFKAALTRAKEQVRQRGRQGTPSAAGDVLAQLRRLIERDGGGRLAFKSGADHFLLETRDIVWIEAQGRAIRIGAAGQTHVACESLQSVERRLDPAKFIRIHRSFIVNVRWVRKITPAAYGDYTVLMGDGAKVRLSRTFRDQLERLLSESEG